MSKAAKDAILDSIRHNRIVTIEPSVEATLYLRAECDDSVDMSGTYGREAAEYWGTDEDGDEWRVHMDGRS